ncbi:uncharacterized protein LOC135392376 [Ornithodoros turicata]|uniref:uncharacterized protein LOC135392376 n=1 Tax=Ornithodoros turicata TaxID=34597 RepID=UPI003139E9E7
MAQLLQENQQVPSSLKTQPNDTGSHYDTSSNTAELHGILKALRFIKRSVHKSWLICTDSKSALQAITKQCDNNFLVYKILVTIQDVIQNRHNVTLQWIPSHCGIQGNKAADKAAKAAVQKTKLSAIPFSKADSKIHLKDTIQKLTRNLWKASLQPANYLSTIDPGLTRNIPVSIDATIQTAIHRTRLGQPCTRKTLHKMKLANSSLCRTCNVPEDTHHVIMFERHRRKLQTTLEKLDNRPFSFYKILVSWPSPQQQDETMKALCAFLKNSGISSRY